MLIGNINHECPNMMQIHQRLTNGIAPLLRFMHEDIKHCMAAGCAFVWQCDENGRMLVLPEHPVVIVRMDGDDRVFIYEQLGPRTRATMFHYKEK